MTTTFYNQFQRQLYVLTDFAHANEMQTISAACDLYDLCEIHRAEKTQNLLSEARDNLTLDRIFFSGSLTCIECSVDYDPDVTVCFIVKTELMFRAFDEMGFNFNFNAAGGVGDVNQSAV